MIFTVKKDTQTCGCSVESEALNACPVCGTTGIKVKAITVKSQLKKEKLSTLASSIDDFSFCTHPECHIVYYSNDAAETFGEDDVKSKVALKNDDPNTPLCYCKKLLKKDVLAMIANSELNIAVKVKAIIAEGKSFCEKSNPKGVCCTEDVKDYLAVHGISWQEPKAGLFTAQAPSSCC